MQPLRYVVLQHSTGQGESHFDLMFETLPGSMLSTWRSDNWPIESPVQLQRLRDHRRLYLDYEGNLTDQRGTVCRIAEGTCQVQVGANAIWTIRIIDGTTPQTLLLSRIDGDVWQAEPA